MCYNVNPSSMPDNARLVDRLPIRFRSHLSVGICLCWLVGRVFVSVGWSFRLIGRSIGWSVGLSFRWFIDWSLGFSVGRSVSEWMFWLLVWQIGQFVGRSFLLSLIGIRFDVQLVTSCLLLRPTEG